MGRIQKYYEELLELARLEDQMRMEMNIYGPVFGGPPQQKKTEEEMVIEKRQKDCRHNQNPGLFIRDNIAKVTRCPFCGMDKPL